MRAHPGYPAGTKDKNYVSKRTWETTHDKQKLNHEFYAADEEQQ